MLMSDTGLLREISSRHEAEQGGHTKVVKDRNRANRRKLIRRRALWLKNLIVSARPIATRRVGLR